MHPQQQHITDREAYDHYVGDSISPETFVKTHSAINSINEAIDAFLKHWSHPEPVPEWLPAALFRYIEDCFDQVPITRHSFQFASLDFDLLSDQQQEEALRQLLRRMNPTQLQRALEITKEFVLIDSIEAMAFETQKIVQVPIQTESESERPGITLNDFLDRFTPQD